MNQFSKPFLGKINSCLSDLKEGIAKKRLIKIIFSSVENFCKTLDNDLPYEIKKEWLDREVSKLKRVRQILIRLKNPTLSQIVVLGKINEIIENLYCLDRQLGE